MAKTNNNIVSLITPIKTNAYGLPLEGVRQIVSKKTGEINYVLEFPGAQVVMPGSWAIRESEFPNGLFVGQKLNAFWEKDTAGVDRFHLEEVR